LDQQKTATAPDWGYHSKEPLPLYTQRKRGVGLLKDVAATKVGELRGG